MSKTRFRGVWCGVQSNRSMLLFVLFLLRNTSGFQPLTNKIHSVDNKNLSTKTALAAAAATTRTAKKDRPRRPNILCFGNACVDLLAICDHFPKPDEKMRSTQLRWEGGGNAANSACAIGRLSDYANAMVATVVGTDDYGNRIVNGLEDFGVGTHNIERIQDPEATSPFSYILVTPDNARTIIHQPATFSMSPEFCDSIDLTGVDAVHFDGRHMKAANHLALKLWQLGIPYSVDCERHRGPGHEELLSHASVIICSSDYCDNILGPPSEPLTDEVYTRRLKEVVKLHAPNAILAMQTIGSKGSYLIRLTEDEGMERDGTTILSDENDSNVPTVTCRSRALWCETWGGIDIVDSTGAGDSFQGGFVAALWAYAIANSCTLEQIPAEALAHAMRIGTRVAAKKLEALGARNGLPYSSQDGPLQSEFQQVLAIRSGVLLQ